MRVFLIIIYRFRVDHWFQFPSEVESCFPGIDDENKEIMVEGVLSLILTVLSCRLHCGKELVYFIGELHGANIWRRDFENNNAQHEFCFWSCYLYARNVLLGYKKDVTHE